MNGWNDYRYNYPKESKLVKLLLSFIDGLFAPPQKKIIIIMIINTFPMNTLLDI